MAEEERISVKNWNPGVNLGINKGVHPVGGLWKVSNFHPRLSGLEVKSGYELSEQGIFSPFLEIPIPIASMVDKPAINSKSDSFLDLNNIPNLVLWLDAADIGTITDSGDPNFQVSQWDDKSDQNNNVVQSNVPQKPITNNNTINGRNVLVFDGVDDQLTNFNFTALNEADGYTIFFVGRPFVLATDKTILAMTGTSENHGLLLLMNFSDEYRFLHRMPYSNSGGDNLEVVPVSVDPQILTFVRDKSGNTQEIIKDGVLLDSRTTPSDIYEDITHELILGTLKESTTQFPFNGDMGEIIMFDRALTLNELEQVHAYLTNKWITPFTSPEIPISSTFVVDRQNEVRGCHTKSIESGAKIEALLVVGNEFYQLVYNGTSWTINLITEFLYPVKPTETIIFTEWNDKVYFAHAGRQLKYWDGAAIQDASTGAPQAGVIVSYEGFVVALDLQPDVLTGDSFPNGIRWFDPQHCP